MFSKLPISVDGQQGKVILKGGGDVIGAVGAAQVAEAAARWRGVLGAGAAFLAVAAASRFQIGLG